MTGQALSREQKITQIMKLAGVSQRDFESCRKNYESLSEIAIDHKLAALENADLVIREWRQDVNPPAPL